MEEDQSRQVPDAVLEAFGLGGAQVRRLPAGLINRHWLAVDSDQACVIRRSHPSRTRAAVEWEQALVRHAAARGWPVATPVAAAGGDATVEFGGALWSATPKLEGEPRPADSAAMCNITGRLLGRLHRDLAGFEHGGQRPAFAKTWELDEWVRPAGAGSFNDLLRAFGRDYPGLATEVRRQRYRSLRELSRLKYPDLSDLPIHGDFQRANLLWHEGQLTGLLEFDRCRRDALVCDLAPLLAPFRPLDVRLAAALLAGYQSQRPLSRLEVDLLPALARASMLTWVAFLLVEWRTRGLPPAGIARTMTVRFPAFDAAEKGFLSLAAVG